MKCSSPATHLLLKIVVRHIRKEHHQTSGCIACCRHGIKIISSKFEIRNKVRTNRHVDGNDMVTAVPRGSSGDRVHASWSEKLVLIKTL